VNIHIAVFLNKREGRRLTAIKLSAGIANLQISEAAESRLRWSGACTELREAARNNLPTSLALPFDRLRTSDRLRERSMGKLFLAASLR
jgi:hypothetical protein